MQMTMTMLRHLARGSFDYCKTSFDNGKKYSVYYGGTLPLKPGPNGKMVGYVAKFHSDPHEWYATADTGDAVCLRWIGGFSSRVEASLFLVGQTLERDDSAAFFHKGQATPLAGAPRMRDRADQLGFLRSIPTTPIEGLTVVWAGTFKPGDESSYPSAKVVCTGADEGYYSVHTLGYQDDGKGWVFQAGTYMIRDLQVAKQRTA